MGDRVRILNGGECKVLAKLGEGGQGIVYKVSYEGKEMALKWYFIEKMKNPKQFYSNLQRNIFLSHLRKLFTIIYKIRNLFGRFFIFKKSVIF